MRQRYVLFAAVYGSEPLAFDGLRVLQTSGEDSVAGLGLLRRDDYGRTTLERTTRSSVGAVLVGLVVGLAAGLGTKLMWATALIGAVIGGVVGLSDRRKEVRELSGLVGALVPAGGCAIVAITEEDLARRLSWQFDLAQETRAIPIADRRTSELARCLARDNTRVRRALDLPGS